MFKKKITAILLSTFMIISALGFSQITVKATGVDGWQQNDTTWNYYINGSKATNWIQASGKWYHLNSTGAMETGWTSVNSKWYYLNLNGVMATGWINYNNKSYYLNASGDMATSTTTLDGYTVGADGVWNDSSSNSVSTPVSSNSDRVVYYVSGGKSYHYNKSCSTLSRSKNILEGKLQDVLNLGKSDPCDKCAH